VVGKAGGSDALRDALHLLAAHHDRGFILLSDEVSVEVACLQLEPLRKQALKAAQALVEQL
jgi:hypothetical protein